jgi:hypothetical protein
MLSCGGMCIDVGVLDRSLAQPTWRGNEAVVVN